MSIGEVAIELMPEWADNFLVNIQSPWANDQLIFWPIRLEPVGRDG